MIGQLINDFDDSMDNTLEAFNSTFNTSLNGDVSAEVVIGKPVVGGLRELFIEGKMELIELVNRPKLAEQPEEEFYMYEISTEGTVLRQSTSFKDTARMLGSTISTISRYEKSGWKYYGYTVKKTITTLDNIKKIELLGEQKKLPIDPKKARKKGVSTGTPSLYTHTVEIADQIKEFTSMKKICEYLGVSRKVIQHRLRRYPKGKKIGGWSITRKLI